MANRIILTIVVFVSLAGQLNAQSIYTNQELRRQYIENNTSNRSLYGGAPITHITPSFNTITYALGLEFPNYTITPDSEDPSYLPNLQIDSSLKLTGWAARPHISVSLRNIGLGFSVGRGAKKALFETEISGAIQQQESNLEFGEVGLFLYFVPFSKSKRKLRPSIILGGRNINAKHSYSSQSAKSISNIAPAIKRYNVTVLELGLNIKYQVFRRFGIIPWVDYEFVDTRSIESEARNEAFSESESQLENDLALFWHDRPKVRYGIDLAARFARFEINIGGLLGSVLTTANKKDSITDNAITINLSFDQKGR